MDGELKRWLPKALRPRPVSLTLDDGETVFVRPLSVAQVETIEAEGGDERTKALKMVFHGLCDEHGESLFSASDQAEVLVTLTEMAPNTLEAVGEKIGDLTAFKRKVLEAKKD